MPGKFSCNFQIARVITGEIMAKIAHPVFHTYYYQYAEDVIYDQLQKKDRLHGPRDPRCNVKLQTSFFKPKDSFMYLILESSLNIWMSFIGNPFAYELQLFGGFCASQLVTKIGRYVCSVVHAISQSIHSKNWTLDLGVINYLFQRTNKIPIWYEVI